MRITRAFNEKIDGNEKKERMRITAKFGEERKKKNGLKNNS